MATVRDVAISFRGIFGYFTKNDRNNSCQYKIVRRQSSFSAIGTFVGENKLDHNM